MRVLGLALVPSASKCVFAFCFFAVVVLPKVHLEAIFRLLCVAVDFLRVSRRSLFRRDAQDFRRFFCLLAPRTYKYFRRRLSTVAARRALSCDSKRIEKSQSKRAQLPGAQVRHCKRLRPCTLIKCAAKARDVDFDEIKLCEEERELFLVVNCKRRTGATP